MKQILVSGMQPTGRLHIGNYLGALRNFVDLQNSGDYACYFFIVDLHSLTENFDPREKHAQILDLAADYLAAGLDPKKSVLFLQSLVPAHSELAWILNTVAPMGELERMTQYKDKASRQSANVNAGLFTYPVLMASDILLYDPHVVPVGDDQRQHLELTRSLARRFNGRFGETFREPKDLLTRIPRVMSLKDPSKKMSKSQPEGCLFLDDTPEEIAQKIARAVTDSGSDVTYDRAKKPGLANLIDIYAALTHMEPRTVAEEFGGKKYSQFKMSLAEVVAGYFADFRARKAALLRNPKRLASILRAGSKKADVVARRKMRAVSERVGIAF
ncbi:MAG TPA: tryptophan--tRNA ligase [Candidatus Paceibacterota bacterium]|nr:tryptophan--tRNA ligase [Candidatus Paceibacterota bacterium]